MNKISFDEFIEIMYELEKNFTERMNEPVETPDL